MCILFLAINSLFAEEKIIATSLPLLEVEMVSPQSGIISSILVQEGDYVKKNQIIALLQSDFLIVPLNIALTKMNTKGELIAAKSQLKLAQSKLNKVMELLKRNHARSEEVEKTEAEVKLAEANVLIIEEKGKITKLEVQQIQFKIEQHKVRSPFRGIVRKIIKQVGESISEVQPIISIVQLHEIQIETFPSFEKIRNWKVGDKLKVFFPQTKQQTKAIIKFIDPVVDFASNTVRVVAGVENNKNTFRSGLKCWVFLEGSKK